MSLIPLFDALARRELRLRRCGEEFSIAVRPGVDGAAWLAYVQQQKLELLRVLCLIQQAYPDGVPAQVPYERCLLCGWRFPAVLCRFKDGQEGYLCVGCVVAETQPEVNRSVCEICDRPIVGSHHH